jgi:transposase
MLSLSLTARIFVYTRPTDMRKSFDGLAALVRDHLGADPLSGQLFVFRGRRGDRLKMLYWDEDGLVVWAKRLEEGTFQMPASTEAGIEIKATDLAMILGGIDLHSAKRRPRYQRPKSASA